MNLPHLEQPNTFGDYTWGILEYILVPVNCRELNKVAKTQVCAMEEE